MASRTGCSLPARLTLCVRAEVSWSRSAANAKFAASGLHTITHHSAFAPSARPSKIARQRRRNRLRLTAFPTFFVIKMPSLGGPPASRTASVKTVAQEVPARAPRRKTSANSRRPLKLTYLRKASWPSRVLAACGLYDGAPQAPGARLCSTCAHGNHDCACAGGCAAGRCVSRIYLHFKTPAHQQKKRASAKQFVIIIEPACGVNLFTISSAIATSRAVVAGNQAPGPSNQATLAQPRLRASSPVPKAPNCGG